MVGLDPYGIRTLKEAIRERAQAGAAVVLSSHMLSLVEDVCTRLLVLHHGRLVFLGTIDEARARAATTDGTPGRLEDMFFTLTGAG
jgi:ABC-2 type transport system ATP-binding protein